MRLRGTRSSAAAGRAAQLAGALLVVLLFGARPGALSGQETSESVLTLYQQRRGWLSQDKAYHFTVSAIGSGGIYGFAREVGMRRRHAVVTAALLMGTAGFLREALDGDEGNRLLSMREFSRKDMAWNAAGIVAGIALTDRLLRHRWKRPRVEAAVGVP